MGAGLTLGFYLPNARAEKLSVTTDSGEAFAPNAFIRIAHDDTVTVIVKHLEAGQGVFTGLPALIAEELEVPWEKIKVEAAPADRELYKNLLWGNAQGTGGSTAMANSYDQMRRAGATARAMLIEAAAQVWQANPNDLRAENGHIVDSKNKRSLSYGKLVDVAATLELPWDIQLKSPKDFKVIGKTFKRTDTRAKTLAQAEYASDMKLPGMLTAVLARPPMFGGKIKAFKAERALTMPGVKAVFEIENGVAVVATDTWSAIKGRKAVEIEWQPGDFNLSSAGMLAAHKSLAQKPGNVAANKGDAEGMLGKAAKRLSMEFEVPYLAHSPMEPLNCVVDLRADGCDIWAGIQMQTLDQANAARVAGLEPEQVKIHTTLAGGTFGRRSNTKSDYIVEGVHIAKKMRVPIKLIWTREDDVRGGFYRPCYFHRLEAGLDAQGKPVAWWHRIVGQSIFGGTIFERGAVKDGVDRSSVEGAANLPYDIPNLFVDLHSPKYPVPVLWWRSVGSTHTAYVTEVFIDALAVAAKADPYRYRRKLLKGHDRHLAVLDLAAKKAGWGKPLPKGWGRGIAVHESFNSVVAQVAEVRVEKDGRFKVERVVCAVDCGLAITPDVIRAQMEGGIGFGLSATLFGEITLKDGGTEQSNFHDYRVLRIDEMPKVEVHIVPSDENPTGVGEPGVPPIAPAVVNAIHAATGKRISKLPIGDRIAL